MQPIGAFALAILAGLFCQEPTPSPSPGSAPEGSYQQTCSDISVKNGNLYAKCHDEKGKPHSARLSHYEKCSGEIVNKKGSLECSHAPGALPPGPYAETCKNPQMRGTTLHAVCRSVDGREMPVSLKDANRCSQGVANINGILSCVVNDVIPPGSYMATCKDIRVQGSTLYASCNDSSNKDRWLKTQLRDAHKCSGDITNYHGELRCAEIKKMEKR
jgi:CVNH domain-containing protein